MAIILAIDLGKYKSVACTYLTDTEQWTFQTVPTQPNALHDLIVMESPDPRVQRQRSVRSHVDDDLSQAVHAGDVGGDQ